MKTRLVLATLVLAIATTSGLAHAGQPFDHLKCFKIRDSLVDRRTIYLADIYPQIPFEHRLDCRLRLPASHFCVNVAKENVEIIGQVDGEPFEPIPVDSDDGRDYLCYDLKCDRDRFEAEALDQFGARRIRIRKSDFLCMPANKIVPSPEPTPPPIDTPTPTPTATPIPTGCQAIIDANVGEGTCGGDCPTDQFCGFFDDPARGPGGCQCLPDFQACSAQTANVDRGICGGFCPSVNEACVPDQASASGNPETCECVLR